MRVDDGKLILIDGNSLANRAFFALPRLTTSAGVPTNAVYGFVTMLLRLLEEEKPEYVAVAFDKSAPTFRHLAAETYKAQRSGSPEDFKAQIPLIKKVLNTMKIRMLELEGFEADDIIGTLASRAGSYGLRVLIVSGDKDMLQLVDDHVTALITRRGISQVDRFDREGVKSAMGVYPEQIPDYKSLAGDQSDNIKGVTGIGPKTAVKLLEQFGTLEQLLDHVDEVASPHLREALRTGRQQALLSKHLASIRKDVPVSCEPSEMRIVAPDMEALVSVFEELEFRSQVDRAKDALGPYMPSEPCAVAPASEYKGSAVGFTLVDSGEAMERMRVELARAVQNGESVGLCVSSTGRDPRARRLVGMAIYAMGEAWYLPDQGKALSAWEFLEQAGARIVAFDAKNCMNVLANAGARRMDIRFDPGVAAYLLDPTRTSYYPQDLAREYLGKSYPRMGAAGTAKRPEAFSTEDTCALAGVAYLLEVPMSAELQRQELDKLFRDIEMPLIPVLSAMELEGMGVDLNIAREMSKEFSSKLRLCESEIFQMAGVEFNINSHKQLAEVLFSRLGLPCSKKTKTGYSTDAEVLEELARNYDIAAKVLEYRQLAKLKGTYLDGIEELVNPSTGRIHTTFNQTVTATGRLSSTSPNMQNIPTKGELGRQLRRIFVPRNEDWLFLSADYSQIELRVLAHVSEDATLIRSFLDGEDIHTRTAAEVFGVKPEEVTPSMRSKAKAINFGIIYGQTDYGLSRAIGESRAEAKAYIENYFRRYPDVYKYIQAAIARARETGYARTLLGRKRRLPDINSPNRNLRGFAERTAINTPIQGTAADIMKLAMIHCHEALKKSGSDARILLQVHDELVLEVPRLQLKETADLIRRQMENVMTLRVPLKVSLESGPNWFDMAAVG